MEALWTLPGGRQEDGESLADTVVREFLEETSLNVAVGDLAYVSESIDSDAGVYVVNNSFWVRDLDARRQPCPSDPKVIEARFVPIAQAPVLLQADVVRIPVAAALSRDSHPHYFVFHSKDVAVPFFGRMQRKTGRT